MANPTAAYCQPVRLRKAPPCQGSGPQPVARLGAAYVSSCPAAFSVARYECVRCHASTARGIRASRAAYDEPDRQIDGLELSHRAYTTVPFLQTCHCGYFSCNAARAASPSIANTLQLWLTIRKALGKLPWSTMAR